MDSLWILAVGADEGIEGTELSSTSTEGTTEEIVNVDRPNGDAAEKVVPRRESSPLIQYLPLIAIFIIMYLLIFRGPRKKQQQHQKMVQSLQKNDKVRTIGGILGTVIDVKDDEITLKIDESNNTKIKVSVGAISKVLSTDTV